MKIIVIPFTATVLAEVDKSVEGCLIATSSKDRSIRIWSRTQGKQLFMKKMPQQRHEHREQGGRVKVWVAVHWLKHNPEQLVSSSLRYFVCLFLSLSVMIL